MTPQFFVKAIPEISVNYSITTPTKEKVLVTITITELLEIDPSGWLKIDDYTYEKEYSVNTQEFVPLQFAANYSVTQEINITNILAKDPDPRDEGPDTGSVDYLLSLGIMMGLSGCIGVFTVAKKGRKNQLDNKILYFCFMFKEVKKNPLTIYKE